MSDDDRMDSDEMSSAEPQEEVVSFSGDDSDAEMDQEDDSKQQNNGKSQKRFDKQQGSSENGGKRKAGQLEFDPFAVEVKRKKSGGTFQTMGLLPEIVNAIKKKGYRQPTPIQRKVIPVVLSGSDVVAMARTGSGKTLAFTVPTINKLRSHNPTSAGIRALILSPTRELCQQTYKYAKTLAYGTDLRIAMLTGGDNIEHHFEQLASNPDVVIATPGRLLHVLHETGAALSKLEFLIFDEADRLFEMGFQSEIEGIVKLTPATRQTLLFSATLPKLLMEFTRAGLRSPEIVRLDADQQLSEQLALSYFSVRTEEKPAALLMIIREIVMAKEGAQAIIFTATKHHVEYLYELLSLNNISSSIIYGRMDNSARKINLAKFKKQKATVLIVTDVAARGIDLPQLDFVINYDFPFKPKLFVHRVGRTARAGRSGAAISILQPDELAYLLDLQLFLATTKVQPVLNGQPNGIHGRLPSRQLQMYHEAVLQLYKTNSSLEGAYNSMQNAVKLYRETRIAPSPASVTKAKEFLAESGTTSTDSLIRLDVHPLFSSHVDAAEAAAEEFISKLKGFRPSQTIFEVEKQKGNIVGTKTAQKNSKGKESLLEMSSLKKTVMRNRAEKQKKQSELEKKKNAQADAGDGEENEPQLASGGKKRKIAELSSADSMDEDSDDEITPAPTAKRQKTSALTPQQQQQKFQDEKYFMKLAPSDMNMAIERGLSISDGKGSGNLEEMLLDLAPDDDRSIFRKRSIMKWDQRKRKFVRDDSQDATKQKRYIRNEAGQKVKAEVGTSGKLYKDWMEKMKKRIPTIGEQETSGGQITPRGALPFKHFKNKKDENQGAGKFQKGRPAPRDEVKSVDQIKKSRKEAEKKAQREQHYQKMRAKNNSRKKRQ